MNHRRILQAAAFAVVLAAGSAGLAGAQMSPEWIARLPVGSSLSSGIAGFHVAPDGVSYLTAISGGSSTDITTAAIDADGNTLWTQVWDSGQSLGDQSRGLALSVDGTLWVVGNTPGPLSFATVLLLGYDAATGTLLHEITFESQAFKSESGHMVTTDANGDVYVVGGTVGDGPDVMTIKFDSAGQFVWLQKWDGPASAPFSIDTPKDVRIDPNGDLVVAIHGVMTSLLPDYVVIKYAAADGAVIWESNWGASSGDYPNTMEIDAAGDIYVTGIGFDFIDKVSTVKFRGSDGAILWQEWDEQGFDHASSGLALDGNGGVLIAATSDPDGDNSNQNDDYFAIKRDALTGAQLWTFTFGDSCVFCLDVPSDIEVDSAGNVFLPGVASSSPYSNDLLMFVLDNATGLEIDRGTSLGVGSEIPRSGLVRFDGVFNLYDGGEIYNADTGAVDASVVKWTSLLGGGIPCADLDRFQMRCVDRAGSNKLQFRLLLTDTSHDGESVTVEVDGAPFDLAVAGNRAQMSIDGALPGAHTIELVDPAGCFPARVVTCP